MKHKLVFFLLITLLFTGCGSLKEGPEVSNNEEELPELIIKVGQTKTVKSVYNEKEVEVEITLNNISFSDRVNPPKPEKTFYTYFEEKASLSYLIVDYSVKNLGGESVNEYPFENFLGENCTPNVKFDNKYNYSLTNTVKVEKDSSDKYDLNSFFNIIPLETVNLYTFGSVPKEVIEKQAIINICLGETNIFFNNK